MTILAKSCACFVKYNGKEIYHVDFSNKKTIYDLIDAIEQSNMYCKIHIENYKRKDILMLIDLTNSFVFGKAVNLLNESIEQIKYKTKKRAVIGLKKSKMIFINMVNSIFGNEIKAFDNICDAKKWLVE